MPRVGITYLEVAKTATKLVGQDIHPTIEEVRKVLGTGSNSTINRHLRQWREKQGHQIEAEKGLPETLLIAVKGIYEAIQEEASHKISTIEIDARQKLHDLQVQLEHLTLRHNLLLQNNAALENKINVHQLQEIESQKIINSLNQNIDKKISEIQFLQERIDDKKAEIERITQQLKNAQHNLEHYREAVKQERDSEKQRYESQISALEQQLHQHQNNMLAVKDKVVALTQQTELLESIKNKIEADLNHALKNSHDKELLAQRHEINYCALNEEHDKIKSEHQLLVAEYKTAKNIADEMTKNIERLQERVSITEGNLQKAEDKIELLSNKNLFLQQEKSELTSQLKKMQTAEQLS